MASGSQEKELGMMPGLLWAQLWVSLVVLSFISSQEAAGAMWQPGIQVTKIVGGSWRAHLWLRTLSILS